MKSPKTSWALSYLDRKMSPAQQHAWRHKVAAELAEATGVPWSHYHAHGKIIFRPYLDFAKTEPDNDPELLEEIVKGWRAVLGKESGWGLAGFDKIASFSGLTLPKVMAGALALIRAQRANIHVDRMGRATFLKVREAK
jgi:hypothetical protein